MKSINSWTFLLLVLCGIAPSIAFSQVGINATGASGHPSSMLDISSSTKGFLAPRMSGAQRLAIPLPANGLMVYQTTAPIGYWYFDANAAGWTSVMKGSEPWRLNGNTGTDPNIQYLGTSNNQKLAFGTNGTEVAEFTNTGRFNLSSSPPSEYFQVEGGIKQTGSAAANTQGAIQWNATENVHEGNTDGTAAGWYPLENVFRESDPEPWASISQSCAPPAGGYIQIGAGTGITAGTVETPYGTLWEDGKVQYMWLAADLAAAGVCPNEDITALSFNAVTANTNDGSGDITSIYYLNETGMNNARLGMLQTTATDLSQGFESGTVNLWSGNMWLPAAGWHQYAFNSAFTWNGTSNLVVEYCYDNNTWSNSSHVRTDATTYAALYGMFCDACGGTGPGSCAALGEGIGLVDGCAFDNATNTTTCDGSGNWPGGRGPANKRPQVRFSCLSGTSVITTVYDKLLYYQGGLMIGDPTWAASGVFGSTTNPLRFRGPGTIVGERGVWGGGTLLNDYVFDIYFDGEARTEDLDRTAEYSHMPIGEMLSYVERERHLPTIDGREKWDEHGAFSLDELGNQMWVTVEEQALYITELNERIALLQDYLIQQKLGK